MNRIYLDYASTTPVDPRVLKFMRPYFTLEFGNPGSLHSYGQKAIAAVDKAREVLAGCLGVDFREVVFTGSATEANNLALRGVMQAAREKIKNPRLIVSAIEHESVLETARALEKEGVQVVYLPVNKQGIVSTAALRQVLTPETVLVSVMYVNNETGAIQPIAEIGRIIREFRSATTYNLLPTYPLFHTDAAQAFYLLDCRPASLQADLVTLSAHKIGGPKGAGALYIKKAVKIEPLLTGGGQEHGLRSATENIPAIAGFGRAVELAQKGSMENNRHIFGIREAFLSGLTAIFPKMRLNSPRECAAHIVNIWLPGHRAEDLLTRLDLLSVAVSSGSACRARAAENSYVLKAMSLPGKRVGESVRISFGRATSRRDIRTALRAFREALK